MLNIMAKDPNFVSVRLPDDVANWLREYATTNKMVRADKPNMGGSIIAIVRNVMQGQTISNNVGQTNSNLDATLDERIDAALEAKVDFSIRDISRVADEQYNRLVALLAQNKMDSDRKNEALKLELETIKTAIAALTDKTTSESSSVPKTEGSSLEPDSLPSIEAIATIAAPTIENSLPDNALSDAIAATAKPKPTKRSAKSKAKYTRDELEKLKNTDIRKIYRAEIPVADRALDPNYASKADMIDAILTAKTHT